MSGENNPIGTFILADNSDHSTAPASSYISDYKIQTDERWDDVQPSDG